MKKKFANRLTMKHFFYFLLLFLAVILLFLLFVPTHIIQNKMQKEGENLVAIKPPDTGFDFIQHRKIWKEMLDNIDDPIKAYSLFKEENGQNKINAQHLAAHVFGELLYKKYGTRSITICDGSFSYGCYHGAAVEAISTEGINVASELDRQCYSIKSEKQAIPCRHGIGHGLVEYFGHKKEKLVDALNLCKTNHIEKGDDRFFGCYSGVFMEYNHPATVNDKVVKAVDRKITLEDKFTPCNDLPNEFQESCFHSLPQLWDRYIHDYKKIGQFCAEIKDEDNKIACYRGIGNIIAQQTGYEPVKVIDSCNKIDDRLGQAHCKIESSWLLISYIHSLPDAQSVCNDLDKKYQELCVK